MPGKDYHLGYKQGYHNTINNIDYDPWKHSTQFLEGYEHGVEDAEYFMEDDLD